VRQITTVTIQPDGSAQVVTTQGFMLINPSGQVTSSSTFSAAAASFTRFRIRTSASLLTLIETVIGLILAIYLLITGIVTLRQRPSARRLHLIWAMLKIPLAVVGAVGWYLFIYDLTQSLSSMTPMTPAAQTTATASSTAGAMVFAIIIGVIGCAYPIALLIVMNTRTVREYFRVSTARS
jgi:hypothetical protein